jgi:hypothetical protein
MKRQEAVLSIDAKKKEIIENFKNNGKGNRSQSY